MNSNKTIYEKRHRGMLIQYFLNEETKAVSLRLIPELLENSICKDKCFEADSIVHLKIIGDDYAGGFSQGRTMRNAETTKLLKFCGQDYENTEDGYLIITKLEDGRGLRLYHCLQMFHEYDALEISTQIVNNGDMEIVLEMLTTFSLGGLTPFSEGNSKENLYLHRFRSTWTKEGMHERNALEAFQLEPSATGASANSMRFGSLGSMPVREYFPTVAVEDNERNCFWAVTLAHPSSWQLEAYRKDSGLCISGGIADREFGHWLKKLAPGDCFITPKAYLTVGTGLEPTLLKLAQMQRHYLREIEGEDILPVIYNEFCTTWGRPTLESIKTTLQALKGRRIDYFVIDGGWNIRGLGDWKEKPEFYPNGIKEAAALIKENGFKPGIWFEFESCTVNSEVFRNHKDWILTRDGIPIISKDRAFLDFRKAEVMEYLRESVISFLQKNGFEYLKIDYNETIGIGCDGAESLGEGLRFHMEKMQEFYREIGAAIPNLVIEICASGGHRLEPSMLALGAMASCSDAHEIAENPIIAAELHKLVLPRISQVWVVMRKQFTPARTLFALASGFLGRFCLSGDIAALESWQNEVLGKGISFYHRVSHLIKEGSSELINYRGTSWREPEGYQALFRYSEDHMELLIILHTFGGILPDVITLDLKENFQLQEALKTEDVKIVQHAAVIKITGLCPFDAVVIYAKKII